MTLGDAGLETKVENLTQDCPHNHDSQPGPAIGSATGTRTPRVAPLNAVALEPRFRETQAMGVELCASTAQISPAVYFCKNLRSLCVPSRHASRITLRGQRVCSIRRV